MKQFICALAVTAFVITPAAAKQWKPVDAFAADVTDNVHIVGVDIAATGKAAEMIARFDAKAEEKRKAEAAGAVPPAPVAEAQPVAAGTVTTTPNPHYETLPFNEMVPRVFGDVTKDWGLTKGRPVKLKITVDTLKTANAGMALLGGSSDQLAGMVEVSDAETGAGLGSFYVDVLNSHGGLLGLAMRGAGVREKLVEEFALESSRALTGRKSKTKRA